MTQLALQETINKMFAYINNQLPNYQNSPADWDISEGNVACCIIDETGLVYGKIWGTDKVKGRKYYDIAYRKAVQVWITGYKTMEYEKLVFSGQINHKDFGIELPDLMGWEGGQPLQLDQDTKISCGFSGFKGVNDLKLVKDAAQYVLGKNI
jgi:uncharacterized protein GlcG (DUF336 family)